MGLSGVLPAASWVWLVWVMLCRRRLGSGWFGQCSGASGAGSFAYESVCRRARAVGAGYAGESDVALTPACATRTAVGYAGESGVCFGVGLRHAYRDGLCRKGGDVLAIWFVDDRR